jgi:uncharacterized protein YdaT
MSELIEEVNGLKEVIEFCEMWWEHTEEGEQISQDEIDVILELVALSKEELEKNTSLITTIESLQTTNSELEMELVLAERVITQKKEILKDVENRMSEVIDTRDKALDQIESLKAITELMLEWAKNDISIWSKVGQHVGTPKFTSLHVAREIKEMIERLQNDK